MDPSRYYAQPGPSTQYAQPHQQDISQAAQMQVVPLDEQALRQYIGDLYRNPSRAGPGPTNDPAFYAQAQQNLLHLKHRLERMLLVNQQHAEIAQMGAQIPYAPSLQPPQVAQGAPHQQGIWTGSASGPWTYPQPTYPQQPAFQQPAYPQQAYTQPVAHAFSGQFVADMTMHDATHQQVQPQSRPQAGPSHENPKSAQRHAVPLPDVGGKSQSQPVQQTTPLASTSHTQNVHPQSQPLPQQPAYSQSQQPTRSQTNPLQPGHQINQASSATVQNNRETTQKQLHYLQLLAQQHQRTQSLSHQNSPASSQTALPTVPPIPTVSDRAPVQPAQLGLTQRSSSPQQEPPTSTVQAEGTEAVNLSPTRIRSRKLFALDDLRPGRRQSTAPSNSPGTPSREMNLPDSQGADTPIGGATPASVAKPAGDSSQTPAVAEPGPSQKSLTQQPAPPHTPSNTPPLSQQTQIAVEPASIPIGTTDLASGVPNASAPALNNATESIPASSSAKSAPKASTGSSKMKIALDNLHMRGVDCVALIKQAAQIANVSVHTLPEQTGPVDTSIPLFAPGQPLDVWTSNLQVTRVQGDAIVKGIWDLMKRRAREIGIDADTLKHPPQNGTPTENEQVSKYGNPIPSVDGVQVASSPSDSLGPGASQHVTTTEQPQITPSVTDLSSEPRPPSTQPPMEAQVTPPEPEPATVSAPVTAPTPAPVLVSDPPPVPDPSPAPALVFVPAAPVAARPDSVPLAPPEVTVPTPQIPNAPVLHAPPPAQPGPSILQSQLAQRYQYNPYPNGLPRAQPVYQAPEQSQPLQAHTPAYVPPNLGAQTQIPAQAPQPQVPAVSQSQSQTQSVKAKPRKTAALDFLREMGMFPPDREVLEASSNPPNKPVVIESVPTPTKDKGKGKAVDVEMLAVPAQPEPSNNGSVAPEPTPPVDVPGPSQVLETSPSPPAPTIAVLPEPSPTPPSPLSMAEDITRPMTPIAHSPPVVHAPTPVQPSTSTIDTLEASVPTQISTTDPVVVEAPPSPIPTVSTENPDPVPPATSQTPDMLSPPIASISALTLYTDSSPPESAPLKRKRESVLSDSIEAGPGPNTEERARQQQAVNKYDQKRPKMAKRDSTTTSVARKSHPGPYPNIPRPDSPPPNNSWAQSYATAMNLANRSERPLFRPETPPSSPSKSQPAKRRMIMEVVIPLRKKGKLAADLMSDTGTGTEQEESLGLDEVVDDIHDDTRTEVEPDLKMIRRRLRPHMCEWAECIGPPVLSSVELLGVHLNRHHLNCRDPKSGYYMCRWANCALQFKNSKRLWSHISEKHVRHPLHYCDRTTSERYRMIVHVNRAHRGNPDAKLRVFAQPEDFPLGRADPEEGVVLRPDAFPDGVPYFRIMGMALRYEIVPARISPLRHARIGPIILRNISAPEFVSVPRQTNNRIPEQPVLVSPRAARPQVRLGTVPPDTVLERVVGPPPNKSPVRRITTVKGTQVAESSSKAKNNPSPARSHITISSGESSPEPQKRNAREQEAAFGKADRSPVHQSSQLSAPKAPRYQLVVELPSRGKGGSSPRK